MNLAIHALEAVENKAIGYASTSWPKMVADMNLGIGRDIDCAWCGRFASGSATGELPNNGLAQIRLPGKLDALAVLRNTESECVGQDADFWHEPIGVINGGHFFHAVRHFDGLAKHLTHQVACHACDTRTHSGAAAECYAKRRSSYSKKSHFISFSLVFKFGCHFAQRFNRPQWHPRDCRTVGMWCSTILRCAQSKTLCDTSDLCSGRASGSVGPRVFHRNHVLSIGTPCL